MLTIPDRSRFHEYPQALEDIGGIEAGHRAPQPPWGPGFNQPAEHAHVHVHVHDAFKSSMECQLNGLWGPENMEEC